MPAKSGQHMQAGRQFASWRGRVGQAQVAQLNAVTSGALYGLLAPSSQAARVLRVL